MFKMEMKMIGSFNVLTESGMELAMKPSWTFEKVHFSLSPPNDHIMPLKPHQYEKDDIKDDMYINRNNMYVIKL